jgi:hypothetical protein
LGDPLLQQQPHRGQVGDVIHLGAQPARDVGMPVDAQRLGGVLDQPRPQDQPVGDQRFHETHRRPPGRACSELTGRDGRIGQDGDLLVRQVVDDRQASSPSVAGRPPAQLVSDPTESIT